MSVVRSDYEKYKKQAVSMRSKGRSYSDILKEIPVSKATLSVWLRDVGLSRRQKQKLTEKKLASARRGAATQRQKRISAIENIKNKAKCEIRNISDREFWLLGTALYWAEGGKEKLYSTSIGIRFSNSDIAMILLFKKWLKRFLGVQNKDLKYELYIHDNADWAKDRDYWARKLSVPNGDIRVYFKKHNPKTRRQNSGSEYIGLMRICVARSSNLVRKIAGWIEGVEQHCGVVQW